MRDEQEEETNTRVNDDHQPHLGDVETSSHTGSVESSFSEPQQLFRTDENHLGNVDDNNRQNSEDTDRESLLPPFPNRLPRWAGNNSDRNYPHNRERNGSLKRLNAKFDWWRKEISSKYRQYNRRLRRGSHSRVIPTEIYYTVFKPPRDIIPYIPPREGLLSLASAAQSDFNGVVAECIRTMESGVNPRRISQGSSGSYFVYGSDGRIRGIFKPKDEEPYGPLSPKWTKWLHRNLFPCFFGRSCLIPNNGYICEAAACVLDNLLQTYIVPHTDTVFLSSPSFYYQYFDRRRYYRKGRPLPEKVGSFQLFLHDYTQANEFLRKYPLPEDGRATVSNRHYQQRVISRSSNSNEGLATSLDPEPVFRWTPEVIQQFREELEKLVILDYVMRNTDRGLDNWMIKIEWHTVPDDEGGSSSNTESPRGGITIKKIPRLKIGAIDSGLSWPWKHPDEWRSYPFGWLFLPLAIIGKPFSQKTRDHFLPLLSSSKWWEESAIALREVFSRDSEFKERMWRKQWAVMKGQAFNVVEALKDPTQGPLELARQRRMLIWDDAMEVPLRPPINSVSNAIDTPMHGRRRRASTTSTPLPDEDDNSTKLSTFPALVQEEGSPKSPVLLATSLPAALSPRANGGINNSVKTNNKDQNRRIKRKNSGGSLPLEARYRALEENRNLRAAEQSYFDRTSSDRVNQLTSGPGVSLWSELINEEGDDEESTIGDNNNTNNFTGSASSRIRTVPTSNDVGFSYAECLPEEATKMVIVERMQTVKSKPPVFTWC